jgi:hypothetical protein
MFPETGLQEAQCGNVGRVRYRRLSVSHLQSLQGCASRPVLLQSPAEEREASRPHSQEVRLHTVEAIAIVTECENIVIKELPISNAS